MEKDYQGQIVTATTEVTVADSDGARTYDIRIELKPYFKKLK
jgi:hypothetical protein